MDKDRWSLGEECRVYRFMLNYQTEHFRFVATFLIQLYVISVFWLAALGFVFVIV